MLFIKKMYLNRCLQPGAKGLEARKQMETSYKLMGWIPIVGLFLRMIAPNAQEIEEAMNQKNRSSRY